jgi:type IV pilus assembly protein PilQ
VEAAITFSREVGFDWGTVTFDLTEGHKNWAEFFGGALDMALTASNLPANSAGEIGFSFTRLTGTPFSIIDAKLQAGETQGNTKTIASPKIITLDNKEALISQGFEVPYAERDSSGLLTTEFKEVNLDLTVTPHVTPDDRISLKIDLEKKDVIDETADEPALSTNHAQTELLVNDGDTIVIGGVIKTTLQDSEVGVPGFRGIPFLGWLFQSYSTNDSKTELLIFITPRIVQLEQRQI